MLLLIGDVQGCDDALARLLAEAGFSPSRGQIVVLGDLVNRGPRSLAVLERLSAMGSAATCLLGNHDLHLLAAAHGVRPLHRSDTVQDILAHPRRSHWLDWLRHRPLAVTAGGWLCVHAGIPGSWTAAQTLDRAAEVHRCLTGLGLGDFLQAMYGNQPARWDDRLAGHDRHRFIVNALTRMRFCQADGTMDFATKDGAAAAPPGFMPWFDVPARATADTPVAFGHWSTLGLLDRPRLLGLDTGCVWGGQLSAMRVDGGRRELVQVACEQAQVPG